MPCYTLTLSISLEWYRFYDQKKIIKAEIFTERTVISSYFHFCLFVMQNQGKVHNLRGGRELEHLARGIK